MASAAHYIDEPTYWNLSRGEPFPEVLQHYREALRGKDERLPGKNRRRIEKATRIRCMDLLCHGTLRRQSTFHELAIIQASAVAKAASDIGVSNQLLIDSISLHKAIILNVLTGVLPSSAVKGLADQTTEKVQLTSGEERSLDRLRYNWNRASGVLIPEELRFPLTVSAELSPINQASLVKYARLTDQARLIIGCELKLR